jgi:hypothetical protein
MKFLKVRDSGILAVTNNTPSLCVEPIVNSIVVNNYDDDGKVVSIRQEM